MHHIFHVSKKIRCFLGAERSGAEGAGFLACRRREKNEILTSKSSILSRKSIENEHRLSFRGENMGRGWG